jgi:helix-turn-helix protein
VALPSDQTLLFCCRQFGIPLPTSLAVNESLRRQVGIRLRGLRVAQGVTSQEQLGLLAGMHRTYVGRIERGESGVTVESLAKLLEPMGISLEEFFEGFR